MPKSSRHTAFLVFCGIVIFVLGASAGFFFSDAISEDKVDVPELDPQVKVVTKIEHQEALPADDTELRKLRGRIAELEEQLEEQNEAPRGRMRGRGGPGNRFGPEDPPQGNDAPRQPRLNFKERMEKMKEEEPERYAEMQKRFTEMRDRRKAESQSRKDFFGSVDTSRMTAEQKANHTALLNACALIDSYQERMGPDSEQPLTQEENREFWEANRQMHSLMEGERQYILGELGKDCGMDGDEFVEYIETVYSQTGRGGFRNRQPPPPPPGN